MEKVEIKHLKVDNIPVLELYQTGTEKDNLPLVVFYHGWESRKERVLEQAYILAKHGFRAVLPEAFNHGERKTEEQINPLDFWSHVERNMKEFPLIIDYYKENNLIDEDKISVAGLSFGGITTSALLTQYDWIHSAAILMGTPAPKEFSLWILKNNTVEGVQAYDLIDKQVIEKQLEELAPISLSLQPQKIAYRPVYFWHGQLDPIVPFHLTKSFIDEIKNEPFSENIVFDVSENVGHEVPQTISKKMAEFFKEHENK